MKAFVHILAAVLLSLSLPLPAVHAASCSVPPFIRAGIKPNVLVILDNSNSMDEDFYGEAVNSYSTASKSVVAKNALKSIIDQYQESLRVGLMTYKLTGVSAYYLHNSPYFASYDPRAYCPTPSAACVEYCKTENSTSKDSCEASCRVENSLFDATYFDEIISSNSIGSDVRNHYCELIYPKTKLLHFDLPSSYGSTDVYFKGAYPYYNSSMDPPIPEAVKNPDDAVTGFCHATTYSYAQGASNSYKCYTKKKDNVVGSSDTHPDNYYNNYVNHTFGPTDSDYALGFGNFGRRLMYYHAGRTWFSNSSPTSNQGYRHVSVGDLSVNGVQTNTFLTLMNRLDPKEEDEAGYMDSACMTPPAADTHTNTCHLINAGLTPTAGTLASAITYLSGASTPIIDSCQKTFVIYVTDGLPSVDESGVKDVLNPDNLMPAVISKITQLRSLTVGGISRDIRTYILGVGMSDQAKQRLDTMALAGGTARPSGRRGCTNASGCAYYADNATQLNDALIDIFSQLGDVVAAAGAVATVSQEIKTGDVVIRGAFKAYDPSDPETFVWEGHLESYWPYDGCDLGDGNESRCEGMVGCHYRAGRCTGSIYSFQPTENLGKFCSDIGHTGGHCLDGANVLANVQGTSRSIFTWLGTPPLKTSISSAGSYLNNLMDLDGDADVDTTDADLLKNWIMGGNATNARNRHGWLMGDIVYSTPVAVGEPSRASVPRNLASEDCSTLTDRCFHYFRSFRAHRDQMVYVGANDGMLHAFNLGKWSALANRWIFDASDGNATDLGKERWAYIPSNLLTELQALANPTYGKLAGCRHRYMVDLSPQAWEAKIDHDGSPATPKKWTTVLLGGEKEGGDVYFALDITDPGSPDVLWEYSILKDYPGPTSSPNIAAGFASHYDYLKTMNMTWSQPYMGKLLAPTYSNPNPYVAIIGGGAREPTPDLIDANATIKLSGLQGWEYLYYPTFHAIDMDTGTDLWKATFAELVDQSAYRDYFPVPSQRLQNTGFETRTGTASDPTWTNWTKNKGTGNINDISSASYAHSGTHAAKLISGISTDTYISNTLTVVPGTTYKLTFWTRGDSNSASAGRYQVIDATHSSNIIGRTSTSVTSSTYQMKSASFTVPAGCTSITVQFWCAATSGRSCYFDDVAVLPFVVPHAVANVAALDLFDANGRSVSLGGSADGYTDVVFGGDSNGVLYMLPTNTSGASVAPSSLITRKTKSVTGAKSNPFRGSRQPITVTPAAALDEDQKLRVFFGTGKFSDVSEATNDRTDNATMTFYAMVQDLRSRIIGDGNVTTITSTPIGVYDKCSAGTGPYRWVKYEDDNVTTGPDGDSCFPCQLDFDRTGERVIDSALVAAGYVFFTTFIPSADPCNAGGTATLYVLDYMCRPLRSIPIIRGGALSYRAVGSSTTWTSSKPDQVAVARVDLGAGMPSRPVMDSHGENIIIQTSDTRLVRLETDLGYSGNAKVSGWTREAD